MRMCVSNLPFNVNKCTGTHWSLSPSDITQTRIGEISCVQGFIICPMVIGLWRPIHVSIHLRCYRQEWDNPLSQHSHHPISPEADPTSKITQDSIRNLIYMTKGDDILSCHSQGHLQNCCQVPKKDPWQC